MKVAVPPNASTNYTYTLRAISKQNDSTSLNAVIYVLKLRLS